VSQFADDFAAHLRGLAGPYLFVGSGFSLRYANLPNWAGLLRHFAEETQHDYEYYKGLAGTGDLPAVASRIAAEFYEVWWREDRYADSRAAWKATVTDGSSAVKIEIAQYLAELQAVSTTPAALTAEYDLLRNVTIDGVITTNYDTILERTFPGYRTYIGQDELLFAETQGIAEIYKIHGCVTKPSSLVLTDSDYDEFDARNVYLAAKLLTLFVEHPVIFLGYGMGDRNISSILTALAKGLRRGNIAKLHDRLIFVQWDPAAQPSIGTSYFSIEGTSIPYLSLTVPNYSEIFSVLGRRERAIPARWMRILKEQVFEIVKTGDPASRLYATTDIDDTTKLNEIDVVFGIGAKMTTVGLVGISRWDLVDDLLGSPDRDLDPGNTVLRFLAKQQLNTYFPCFKYLRAMGVLNADGSLKKAATLPEKVAERHAKYFEHFRSLRRERVSKTVADLEEADGPEWFFKHGYEQISTKTTDLEGLRDFLIRHRLRRLEAWYSTQYAKLAVVYDWMRYGRASSTGQ
jgi:hypothetical protein